MTTTATKIVTLLGEHGITAEHIETRQGPAVDLHVLDIEGGVRVSKIVNLKRDIAVALGVEDIRIQAPIPGTSYVGIEAPADARTTVDYHDFTRPWYEGIDVPSLNKLALPIPVGQQVGNGPIWGDLAKLPHLLIAGTTGSGKSVAINTLIVSLLDWCDASQVRLHLIDPKRVELVPFAGAPQVESFATDVDEALEVLADLEAEMDRRYELFQAEGVRNIDEWNTVHYTDFVDQVLPRHVIIIDELADLIQANKVEVERVVARLGAVARAAGIHMVLATQRPSVNVVTGIIKGNVPSRWAFTVAAGVDSKVILDSTGAEALYGEGDSLWSPVGTTRPLRVQAVWTSSDEVTRAVESSIERHLDQEILPTINLGAAEDDDDVEIEGLSDDFVAMADEVSPLEPYVDEMEAAVREDLGGLEPAPGEIQPRRHPRVRDRSHLWLEGGLIVGNVQPAEPAPIEPELEEDSLTQRIQDVVDQAVEEQTRKNRVARQWRNLIVATSALVVVGLEVVRVVAS